VSDEMGEGGKRGRVQCFIAGFTDQVFSYVSEREREMGMKFFAM